MHFFYLDESGDTGCNYADVNQPILVVGGISVRDEGWNTTQEHLRQILERYFNGTIPNNFELHSKELLSPTGDGPFAGHAMSNRCRLALELLGLLSERSHDVHYIALDKRSMGTRTLGLAMPYPTAQPYLIAFDYLVTYINWFVKEKLGRSARGMIILDQKDEHHNHIEALMHNRRFTGAAANRVKWVVEFGYTVDSAKNPMVQLSDLVIYCVKRFIEIELSLRTNFSEDTKNFYANCFNLIHPRIARQSIVERQGRGMDEFNSFIAAMRATPRTQWRRHYRLSAG